MLVGCNWRRVLVEDFLMDDLFFLFICLLLVRSNKPSFMVFNLCELK